MRWREVAAVSMGQPVGTAGATGSGQVRPADGGRRPASGPGPEPTHDRHPTGRDDAGGQRDPGRQPDPGGRRDAGRRSPRRHGRLFGLGTGQLVAVEIAVVLVLATIGAPLRLAAAVPLALVVLVTTVGRFRGRWAYEWLALGARYLGRRRALPPGADAPDLLTLVRPDAIVTGIEVDAAPIGVIEDAYALTAVLELGEPGALLGEAEPLAPPPAELLPLPNADQPRVRLQLLLAALPAPALRAGTGSPATSYRQLTEGRVPALQRSFLAVQVRRTGGFTEAELRRALTSAVRRVRRRFERAGLPCRALSPDTGLRVLAELAHLGGTDGLREEWAAVGAGGLRQVSFQLRRWPDVGGDLGRTLLTRVLALPGAATAVSLAAERLDTDEVRVELVVRLACPDPQSLAAATTALRRVLSTSGTRARRLDGTQLAGLAATLPLGGAVDPAASGLAELLGRSMGPGPAGDAELRTSSPLLARLELPRRGDGLMMGVNRHGEPTPVRLFRPESTRVALFGGVRYAQLLALRALALGARVVVQTGRPQAWEAFARGVSGSGDALAVLPPNRIPELAAATPLLPQLVIVDTGGAGTGSPPVPEAAWRAVLLLRDELTARDAEILARADVVLLPPLSAPEAEVAGRALGLDQLAGNLPRVRPDMIGIVVGRRTLRWTLLSATPIEHQLIGVITR